MENAKASDTSQDKIDFFLLSAHELRTSLSAMKWLFKMLCDGDYGALNDEQKAAITQAMQANERMVGLLNDTMNAIKNDTVVTYAKLPVNMATLMAEMTKDFSNEASEKHIAITYHQPESQISVLGDENRLRIALHNLIENAIKYSNPETEIVVTLSIQDSHAVLTVQDHGAGIPEDKKAHVFERFFRAENTDQAGTGLGLFGTKHIIEQHNGTIAIDSKEQEGTTVTVLLPLLQ
jgi:signal transduction histidine kinase